jgi:hypothetical protein
VGNFEDVVPEDKEQGRTTKEVDTEVAR